MVATASQRPGRAKGESPRSASIQPARARSAVAGSARDPAPIAIAALIAAAVAIATQRVA